MLSELLVEGVEESRALPENAEKTFTIKVVDGESMKDIECPTEVLVAKAPLKGSGDIERFSTGTRFALEQWIKRNESEAVDASKL